MEIQALRLIVTEDELNNLAERHWPEKAPLTKPRVQIRPDGVELKGTYRGWVRLTVATRWQLGVEGGHLTARLVSCSTLGLSFGGIREKVLDAIRKKADQEEGLEVSQDCLLVNLEKVLGRRGVPLRCHLNGALCEAGRIILEAGQAP